jgi:hypothetical protein
MAKRAGNLMAKIVEPENLRLAFWKAARHKQGVEEVENFRNNLNENLLLLRQQLFRWVNIITSPFSIPKKGSFVPPLFGKGFYTMPS